MGPLADDGTSSARTAPAVAVILATMRRMHRIQKVIAAANLSPICCSVKVFFENWSHLQLTLVIGEGVAGASLPANPIGLISPLVANCRVRPFDIEADRGAHERGRASGGLQEEFAMKHAIVLLAAAILFSLGSNGTSNACCRAPNHWLPHYWPGLVGYLPNKKQELLSRREDVRADAAGVPYRKPVYTPSCACIQYW